MKSLRHLALCLVTLGIGAPAMAADFSDPTWPCVQRKVENLSIGLMWPGVPEDHEWPADVAAAADDLAQSLILRRIDLETAQTLVDAFAEAQGRDQSLMGHVFAQVFESLNSRRSALITGIGEYSLSQIALSERIDAARVEMDAALKVDDFDKVDQLEEQLDWDERIFTDRQRSLTYVCETPVLLEKRLYAISQMLIAASAQ